MPPSNFDSGLIDALPWRTPPTFGDEPADHQDNPPESSVPPPPPPPGSSPSHGSWGDPYSQASDPHSYNPWAPPEPPAWPDSPPPPPPQPAAPVPGTAAGTSPTATPAATPAGTSPGVPATDEAAADGAPIVHAFACPRQHLNPPYAHACRICGEPVPPQEGFAAPRPSLGLLRLSTGETVTLDRDAVFGRAPFHADENTASRPQLVQLASPGNDISRSHLRVSLEDWFVQVTDLASTNGTVVTLPDQAPVRLRPHDPFTILPGTTINIADEVTLRYEVS